MRILIVFFFCFISFLQVNAQGVTGQNYWQLKLEREMEEMRKQDSIVQAQDSLQMLWIKSPSPDRPNQFIDSLKVVYTVKNGDILAWGNQFKQDIDALQVGITKEHRELWVVFSIGFLLLLFSVLKINYASQLKTIMQAIYSNSALTQLNKEEKIYNNWPFIFLYILFGFIFGMFIYFGSSFYSSNSSQTLNFYLLISLGVMVYFSLKVFFVKVLGFIFEIQSLTKEYNSILFLSYFNAAIFLLPVILIFAFLPQEQIDYLFVLFSLVLVLFFTLQIIRAGYYTLKAYKLSKFYLFLYFCTLEVGPLILIFNTIGL